MLKLLLFNGFRSSSSFVGLFKKFRGASEVKLGFYLIVLYFTYSKSCKGNFNLKTQPNFTLNVYKLEGLEDQLTL